MKRALLLSFLVVAASARLFAQTSDQITFQRTFLLRNVSGTAFNPGETPRHAIISTNDTWTSFLEGSATIASANESGPATEQNESVFSTNWVASGLQRSLGQRGLLMFRVLGSLEPATIPEDGYPQLVQYISFESGGPAIDRMRAHDAIGEAAVDFAYRLGTASYAHVYAGAVGDPALGAVPYAQRASSEEFLEAPFAYDVQEMAHQATRVITGGFGATVATIEGSVFHHSISTGRHGSIEDGDIDSWSGRLVLTPTRNFSLQISRGSLGATKKQMTSASASWVTDTVASSAIWTRRESDLTPLTLSSFAFELLMRAGRNTFLGRAERVDDPISPNQTVFEHPRTHLTIGYLFDVLKRSSYRAGVGVNIDYHTSFRTLPAYYGHKPQSIYTYVRVRTEAARR